MNVTLVGCGMGGLDGLTGEARRAIADADAILGSGRLLAVLAGGSTAETLAAAHPVRIADAVESHPEWKRVCVLLSGDVGFYSGARQLRALLRRHEVKTVCGISTPQYFAARLGRPWQNFRLVSAHGAACDVLAECLNHPEVLFLTGGAIAPGDIAAALCEAGLDDAGMTVGENLSSAGERIVHGSAGGLRGEAFASLSVVLVENRRRFARSGFAAGIEDAVFARGGVPMTKREVRAMALSLLNPRPDSVIVDVGAGTGSVSVEAALLARRGRVFAVEPGRDALELIRTNRERFGAHNIVVVEGEAPGALAGLPAPDRAFIGGSNGKMREIVKALFSMNPRVRLVASAASLETLSLAVQAMDELGAFKTEVCQIAASRSAVKGGLRLLTGLNPVFLISGGGVDE